MVESATALDFREMLRKERELALKRGAKDSSVSGAPSRRYLSRRRRRLDLKRDHRVESDGQVDGIYYVRDFVNSEEGKSLQTAARSGGGGGDGGGCGGNTDACGNTNTPEWKDLHKRRLQIHGGTPHPSGMVEEELPLFLREVCQALVESGIFPEDSPPNHVLLNEYSEGQGIGPHKDGPLYEGRVAILSLGKEAFLDFWRSLEDAEADCTAAIVDEGGTRNGHGKVLRDDPRPSPSKSTSRRAVASVRCEDCSLVVFEGQAYYDHWHGIAASPLHLLGNGSSSSSSSSSSDSGDACKQGGQPHQRLSFTVRRVARVVSADSVIEHPEARSEMERRKRAFERSVTETGTAAPAI